MALRLVYRFYGGENRKNRPDYYSKLLCLLSFLRAAEEVDASVVFLVDGPAPDEPRRLMEQAGEIVALPGLGMRGSFLAALRHATSGRWDGADFVWLSEDDYLYLPDSLRCLADAVAAIPDADYLALYGSTPAHPAKRPDEPDARRPAGWRRLPPWTVDGRDWVRIYSTASTFGARVGALAEDLGIFRQSMVPHRNQYRDHEMFLVLQGFEPYGYGSLAQQATGRSPGDARSRLRQAALAPFELAGNLRAHRRPSRRRLLLCADPNLATHVELGYEASGTDWAAVASDTWAWAAARGRVP